MICADRGVSFPKILFASAPLTNLNCQTICILGNSECFFPDSLLLFLLCLITHCSGLCLQYGSTYCIPPKSHLSCILHVQTWCCIFLFSKDICKESAPLSPICRSQKGAQSNDAFASYMAECRIWTQVCLHLPSGLSALHNTVFLCFNHRFGC